MGAILPHFNWHDGKKQHDFDASRFLSSSTNRFFDWEVVSLFYSALHYVDSFLSKKWKIDEIYDHRERNQMVRYFLPILKKDYRLLYHLSRDARYDQVSIGQNDVNVAKTWYSNIEHRLTPVVCKTCGYENLLNQGNCEKCGATI